jgi:guanosine-3',5'-bis(diphosphate) 3'-pyrophosphohydrolase
METAAIVASITSNSELIAAAILHDTVEDVEHVTIEMIEKEFGAKVKQLVAGESEKKKKDEAGSWVSRKKKTLKF